MINNYIVMYNDEYCALSILGGPYDEKEAVKALKRFTTKRLCQLHGGLPEETAELVEKAFLMNSGEYFDKTYDFSISDMQARIAYGPGFEDRIEIVQYEAPIFTAKTEAGLIIASQNPDPEEHPGMNINLWDEEHQQSVSVAYFKAKQNPASEAEDESSKDLCIYLFEDPLTDDCTDRRVIHHADVIKRLEGGYEKA